MGLRLLYSCSHGVIFGYKNEQQKLLILGWVYRYCLSSYCLSRDGLISREWLFWRAELSRC